MLSSHRRDFWRSSTVHAALTGTAIDTTTALPPPKSGTIFAMSSDQCVSAGHHNNSQTGFLTLSHELRNIMYTYAATAELKDAPKVLNASSQSERQRILGTHIRSVSHQIRTEISALWLAFAVLWFDFDVWHARPDSGYTRSTRRALAALDPLSLSHIKTFVFFGSGVSFEICLGGDAAQRHGHVDSGYGCSVATGYEADEDQVPSVIRRDVRRRLRRWWGGLCGRGGWVVLQELIF